MERKGSFKDTYITSKDYKHLKELVLSGKRVLGFITYDIHNGLSQCLIVCDCVEVSNLVSKDPTYSTIRIGCRGLGVIDYYYNSDYYNQKSFEELCEDYQLEYIEPTK